MNLIVLVAAEQMDTVGLCIQQLLTVAGNKADENEQTQTHCSF